MSSKKAKSFNHEVFQKAYKRLNLSSINRMVFQRLLGFLIRNDKPFPYSAVTMAEIIGCGKRTIFRAFNELERCRLIKRIGMGKNRKFKRGSIMNKILSTVTFRIKNELYNTSTTATLCHKNLNNRAIVAYKKTSFSLKHKEGDEFSCDEKIEYQKYFGRIKQDIFLGLMNKDTKILPIEDWIKDKKIKSE